MRKLKIVARNYLGIDLGHSGGDTQLSGPTHVKIIES